MFQQFCILVFLLPNFISCNSHPCSCVNVNECDVVTTQHQGQEVFGYLLESNESLWNMFKWSQLTTVVMVDFFDAQLVCLAHRHQTRVMMQEKFNLSYIDNDVFAKNWINEKINFARQHRLDGINLYIDDPVAANSTQSDQLTEFVRKLSEKLHRKMAHSRIVFTVPWAPYNEKGLAVDGKNYDWLAISQIADQLYMMDGQASQWFVDDTAGRGVETCLTRPNLNYFFTLGAVLAYEQLGVDSSKLILGLPFYALDYECIEYAVNNRCYIRESPYRGAICSSQDAKTVPYNELESYINDYHAGRFFDEHSKSLDAVYLKNDTFTYGMVHQVWYLTNYTPYFRLANFYQLAGIGIWSLNYINASVWHDLSDCFN